MSLSKSRIDKAGKILSDSAREYDELALELDYDFEDYRASHLAPLTRLTIALQEWLATFEKGFFIAQRLKRRPQILRKLRRFSVRLTQLQDIGGCRVIVDDNETVDALVKYIRDKLVDTRFAEILRETDYRELGRDDSGYRAFHFVLKVDGVSIELQLRSRLQHYWSESIERTSVIYGYRLKEQEGDENVLSYFKMFSDALHAIESGVGISPKFELDLQGKREISEVIISQASDASAIGGHVNDSIVRAMASKEQAKASALNNWILVFDWSDGNFVFWDMVGSTTEEAVDAYKAYEIQYPEEEKYEVVLIGSSDISSVPQTHSHYFGIEHHNAALEQMEKSIIGFARRSELDVGARRILLAMIRRRYWNRNTILISTLKNHFCQSVVTFDYSLAELKKLGIILGHDPISLDIKKNAYILKLVE